MRNLLGIYWYWHWQNLDDARRIERASAALTAALRSLGVLNNERDAEIHQAKLAFAAALRGKLGHGWRNGRAWLDLYYGDPDSDARGRKLATIGVQWLLLKRQHSIGVSLDVGTGDGDDGLLLSLRIPLFGIYLSIEDVLPHWAQPKRRSIARGVSRLLPAQRELGFSWHNGALWLKLWSDPDESSSRVSWRDARSSKRQFAIHPWDILFGPKRSRTVLLHEQQATLAMPEGDYPVVVKIERRIWMRSRWPWRKKIRVIADVQCESGIPVPGKGESDWDCGDDAIYAMRMPEATVAAALEHMQQSIATRRTE